VGSGFAVALGEVVKNKDTYVTYITEEIQQENHFQYPWKSSNKKPMVSDQRFTKPQCPEQHKF